MKKIGRYEIVEEVGRGAMGVVYKASDPTIGRLVAIKVLKLDPLTVESGTANPQELFMREARAAGRLSHPGIVTIHDALADPETKDNYIVMEYIPGLTLEKVLLTGPPMPVEKSLGILRQIAEALDYAHKQNIIHRDLKPANILLTDDGRAKITDFGIAKIMAREGAKRTAAIMGTPSYMSPEQLTGGEIDARSDLFSLGVLVYLLLTGEKPFPGDTAAVMFKIVYEDPIPPSQLRPQLSAGHDFLALRSLVKDRKKRYGSAQEFLDDLDDVQQGRQPRSEANFPLAEIRFGERTLMAKGPPLTWLQQESTAIRKKQQTFLTLGIAAGIVMLLFLLGAGALIYRSMRKPPPPIATSQISNPSPPTQPTTASTSLPASPVTPDTINPGSKTSEDAAHNTEKQTAVATAITTSQPEKKNAAASKGSGSTTRGQGKKKSVANGAEPATPQPGTSKPDDAPPSEVKPAEPPPKTAEPATMKSPPVATGKTRSIQLICKFELQEAALTISGDEGIIYQGKLAGKKKGGFLHIKGGYGGTLSHPLTFPEGTTNLSVHVQSTDGAVDLTRKTAVDPSSNGPATLQISVGEDKITLHWATQAH